MEKWADAFKNPKGAGDARPTARDIIEHEDLVGKLVDKVILITGGSSGIGVETARALHLTGAHLFLPVRDMEKGEEVVKDILSSSSGQGKIELLKLELDSLQSCKDCAAAFLAKSNKLHILINNAGVMACPEGRTKDGFETQFGTNHIGHFLLFQLLKPALLAASTPEFNARVVNVSSSGHHTSPVLFDDLDFAKGGYNPWKAYGQSKTSNIYLANEIDRRYGSRGLHATSLMPGGIWTPLQKYVDEITKKGWSTPEVANFMKSTEQGAATTVWAAVGKELEGTGGKYLEDCAVAGPNFEGGMMKGGYAKHAFDTEAAKKLWEVSLQLVGMEGEDE